MKEFLKKLKSNNNYSDELINMLGSIIPSFINVLGEQYRSRIYELIERIHFFEYDDLNVGGEHLTNYFDNGKEYRINSIAIGGGFVEDGYYVDENKNVSQKLVVGVSKTNSNNKIQTLIHEICHALSFSNGILDGDYIITTTGFNKTKYKYNGKYIDEKVSDEYLIFNEIITENLAMQIMDDYDNNVIHEPSSYNGYVNYFKELFRNPKLNYIIINDYFNHTFNFLNEINNLFTNEDLRECISGFFTDENMNNPMIKEHLIRISNMSPSEFFLEYMKSLEFSYGENKDRKSNKSIRNINLDIVYMLGERLNNNMTL